MNKKFVSNSNYVLRKVVNSEEGLDILRDFIEAILEIDIKEIKLNSYLNERANYLPKEENFGVADARVVTNDNEEINIGIQFIDGIYYVQTKMLLYYSQIHLNQLEYDDNREFARTITINLLDNNYFSSSEYDKVIKVASNESDIKLEELEIHVIELPKLIVNDIDKMTKKEQWIVYLKESNQTILDKIKINNRNIEKLDNLVEKYWREEKME